MEERLYGALELWRCYMDQRAEIQKLKDTNAELLKKNEELQARLGE